MVGFITLRAGPPTRLSIPRLRLHTSSSTSYLGPPLLIYISLGVLSLDPGGAWGRSITLCGFVFFFVRCSPQPLDPSTCVAVPQAVGKQWPRFARPFRTHPKRPSMATEWQEKRQQCRVRCCARDLVCAPHRFFDAQVALGPPETENDPKRRSDKQNCRL